MNNLPVIEGESLYLRQLCQSDADGNYPNWLNNTEVTKYNSHGSINYTRRLAIEYIDMVINSPKHYVFAIINKQTNTHIGNISLQGLNQETRSAEFAILIGEPSFYGKGIGKEAGKLLIKYGFTELNLHRIFCGTSSKNIGMQKLAIKIGMTQEGVRQDALIKNGIYSDLIEYGIIHK